MRDINKLELAVNNLSAVLSNGKVSQAHIQDLHSGLESLDIPVKNPNTRIYSRILSDIGLEDAYKELSHGRYALTQLSYENSKLSLNRIKSSIAEILERINYRTKNYDINQTVVDKLLDEASWRYNKYNVNTDGEIGRATETVDDSVFNSYVLRNIITELFDVDTTVEFVNCQEEVNKFSPFLNWLVSNKPEEIVFDLEFNVNDVYIKDIINLIISDKITVALNNILSRLTDYYLNSYKSSEFSPEEIKSLVEITKIEFDKDDTEKTTDAEEIDREYWGLVNTKYHGVFNDNVGIELFLQFHRLIYSIEKK